MFKRKKQEKAILNFIHEHSAFYIDHQLGNKKVYRLSIDAQLTESDLTEAFIDFLTKGR